uniref:Siglec family like 2 n=1 Tax=Nannospalax galili TaxID=1026970 RepID=A0A8C6R3A8_NANGA
MLLGPRAHPLLCLELLSHVLMEVKNISVEDDLCRTIPCVLEFSKASSSIPASVDYGLSANLNISAAGSEPRVSTGGLTIGSPEEQDCVLLAHKTLRRDNRTDSFYKALGEREAPTKLLNFSCLLRKNPRCSTSFHGIPTPSVEWWVDDAPVSANSTDIILQVTSTMLAPWANSTILLMWEPEIIRRLRCEGRNQYRVHAFRVLLIPSKNSVSRVFLKGLIQGTVCGAIASSLLFFFLIIL